MRSLNDYFLYGKIDPLGTAGQVYIPCPDGGQIVKLFATDHGSVTGANETLTMKTVTAAGTSTAVTNGTMTITTAGAGAGRTTSKDFSGDDATSHITEGGGIEVETAGDATAAFACSILVVVRR